MSVLWHTNCWQLYQKFVINSATWNIRITKNVVQYAARHAVFTCGRIWSWLAVSGTRPNLPTPAPAKSRDGTTPISNLRCLVISNFVPSKSISTLRTKSVGLKCIEHKADDGEGLKPVLCLLTNCTHNSRCFTSFGKLCIEIPGV